VESEVTVDEVNGDTVAKRVAQLGRAFDDLFREDRIMKNLLCQVGAMVHASLTRHCAAEQHEALAMFKTRVMLQYWRSGQDGMLGANIPKPFLESLERVLSLAQRKAASVPQTIIHCCSKLDSSSSLAEMALLKPKKNENSKIPCNSFRHF
jgi:hypothetical protein